MSSLNLTAREIELLAGFITQCTSANVDWNEVAKASNFKTGKYARDSFAQIKKKIVATLGAKTDDTAAVKAVPAGKGGKMATESKGAKGQAKRKQQTDDEDEEEETPAPKKAKGSAAATLKKGAAKKEDVSVKDEPSEAGQLMDGLDP